MKINEPKTYNTNLTSAAELLGSSKSIREINFSNMSRLEFKFDEGYNINYQAVLWFNMEVTEDIQ